MNRERKKVPQSYVFKEKHETATSKCCTYNEFGQRRRHTKSDAAPPHGDEMWVESESSSLFYKSL